MDLAAWFQELRRRRVIRALLGWGLVSFAVLQVIDPILRALRLPDWALQVVVAVLAVGFPITAGLAWAFDLTRKGIERTGPVEGATPATAARWAGARPAVALVLLGALIGAGVAWLALRHPGPTPGLDGRISVAVTDFANETKEADLDGLSGQLITSLEQSQRLRVLTRSRMVDVLRQLGRSSVPAVDEALGREMALATGVHAVVVATIRRFDQLYAIDLKVLDPAANEYYFTLKEEREGKSSIPGMIDRLSERTREKLRETPAEVGAARVAIGEATTRSYEAWQNYFDGLKLEDAGSHGGALRSYRKAVSVDPRFALAHYRIAWLGDFGGVDAEEQRAAMEAAFREVDRVPAKERLLLQAWKAHLEEREQDAHALYARAAEDYPQDKEIQYLAGDLYLHDGRPGEALPWFERALALDPLWSKALWHVILHLLPDLGRRDEALARARQWGDKTRDPDYSRFTLISALHQSGRPDQAIDAARGFMTTAPSPAARGHLAASLILGDRLEEAEALVRPFASESNAAADRDVAVPLLVTALAHQGRRREALAVSRTWGHIPGAGDSPNDWLSWQLLIDGRDRAPALREAAAIRSALKESSKLYAGLLLLGDDGGAAEAMALGITPWDRALSQGIEAWRRGELGAAVGRLQGVVRLDGPSRGFASWWLAYVAFDAREEAVAFEATEQYERDLSRCGVWRSWGLARLLYRKAQAQERLGDRAAAKATIERLLGWWKRADPDLPLLSDAKAMQAKLAAGATAR